MFVAGIGVRISRRDHRFGSRMARTAKKKHNLMLDGVPNFETESARTYSFRFDYILLIITSDL